MHGGDRIAEILRAHGVEFLFTLCGGHISPILVGAKKLGIRIVDVRHEANAVFAADAVARLTGVPGVAAVTAGPGLTNTITAVKNAQLAQSPLIVFGGATATALKGRGALQDIDQESLMRSAVKRMYAVKRVKDLAPVVDEAFHVAQSGVPGPVFIEVPVDLLYEKELVTEWYIGKSTGKSFGERALGFVLRRHVGRLFAGADQKILPGTESVRYPIAGQERINKAAAAIKKAQRPVMLVGSQSILNAGRVKEIAAAVEHLGIPVYLSGMARGLLGKDHPLQLRHKRRDALKGADLVLLAGVPCDFRLDYGAHIRRKATLISVGRRSADILQNRIPDQAIHGDPGTFLMQLAKTAGGSSWPTWLAELRERHDAREVNIDEQAAQPTAHANPIAVCRAMENAIADDSVLIADGGDFVATAAYTTQPRSPLSWLDPGVFGTLGVGAGFALGAKLVRPDAEVWIIYGDGSVGYTLPEFDTFARHDLPVIAVVGNDASWQQIARDQVDILGDAVGTELVHTDYHVAAEGFGGAGLVIRNNDEARAKFEEAKKLAAAGKPVLVNAMIGKTEFRKGSLSM